LTASPRAERMQAVYDQVPAMADCKGACWISCGPASMTPWERRRLAAAGHPITTEDIARKAPFDFWCDALGPDGRCTAYGIRPLVCRLWGAVEWLPCPHGCRPEGGWLPDEVAFRLILEAVRDGGSGEPVTQEMFDQLRDPVRLAAIRREFAGKGASDTARFRAYGDLLPVAVTRRPGLPRGKEAGDGS